MRLSSFGVIAIDGSVTKPQPGLDFAGYQTALAHYRTTLALKARVEKDAEKHKALPCAAKRKDR